MAERNNVILIIGETSSLTRGCQFGWRNGFCTTNDDQEHWSTVKIFFDKPMYDELTKRLEKNVLRDKLETLFGGRFRRCDFQMSVELTALPQQVLNFFSDPSNDTIVKGSYKIVSCVKLDSQDRHDCLMWTLEKRRD